MSKRRSAPWVPLSVYYFDDEALIVAGEFAETMFVRMMAYAGRHRDWNGRLPRSVVLSRLGLVALDNVPESAPERRLEALLESGLVSAQGQHLVITNWLKWNDAGERVEAIREQDRERKSALTRDDGRSDPEIVPESAPESAPESGTDSGAQDKKREDKKKDLSARRGRFDEFWSIYPKRGKHSNPKEPARQKWNDLVRTIEPDRIIDSARLLAKTREGEDPQHTPQAITWLRQKRWQDDAPATDSGAERHLQVVGPTRDAQVAYEERQAVAPPADSLPW